MSAPSFEPRGLVSQHDACLQVFRGMQPGDWIQVDDLAHRVAEITAVPCLPQSLQSAAWKAQESLAKNGEQAVAWHLGGYKCLRPDEQVAVVLRKEERTRRARRRTLTWATAAVANPDLEPAERHRMQQVQVSMQAQADLDSRRGQRRRPQAIANTADTA